jgi:N-acetylglucosamine kinase-like BadF-type ATPase
VLKYIIGIDGGGTKTIGVLVDESGRVLARKVGESSNIQVIGLERLGHVLQKLVNELVAESGISRNVDYLYAGLAGAGRSSDRDAISCLLKSQVLAQSFTIDTDAAVALAGAFGGGPGIILISGTGAICFGKREDDTVVRSGGWGYLLGDEGSGYYIGNQGILAALKDLDGRGKATKLRPTLESHLGLERIDLIVSKIYSGELDRTKISALAPVVFDLAEQGDQVAGEIIRNAGLELGKQVAAIAEKLGKRGKPVAAALIGSVFKRKQDLIPHMIETTTSVASRVDFIEPRFEPAIGSAIMGLQKCSVDVNSNLLDTLDRSIRAINHHEENHAD